MSQESELWVSSQTTYGSELVLDSRDMEMLEIIEEEFAAMRVEEQPPARQRLSATNLAIHHHLKCDLYLHLSYRSRPPPDRATRKVTEVALAQFEKGDTWERCLFDALDNRGVLRRVDDEHLMTAEEIASLFACTAKVDEDTFISGLTFAPPDFEQEFAARGSRPVRFSVAKPDLIQLRRGPPPSTARRGSRGSRKSLSSGDPESVVFWEIIDAKSSSHVKTSHHVQIGFYARCLQGMLLAEHEGVRFQSDYASIWLPPLDSKRQMVPLAHLFTALDDLIFRRLPEIVHGPEDTVQWHLNPLCHSCPWTARCHSNAVKQGRLGVIPNIPPEEAVTIQDALPRIHETTDIEELDKLFSDPARLRDLKRERPAAMKRILRRFALDGPSATSAVLAAARTGQPVVTGRRTLSFPRSEDVAVVIALALDASSHIQEHQIDVFTSPKVRLPERTRSDSLPRDIATLIGTLQQHTPNATVQFYTFSRAEQVALQRFLIDTALSIELVPDPDNIDIQATSNEIRVCIGALCDGASVVATAFQPTILQEALTDWLGKPSTFKKKAELQEITRRLGLSDDGIVSALRDRLEKYLADLRVTAAARSGGSWSGLANSLPRVVVLQEEIERLIALPSPGFWELPEAAHHLIRWGTQSLEELAEIAAGGDTKALRDALGARNDASYKIIWSVRARIQQSTPDLASILLNDARPLPDNAFMDLVRDPTLRKLFWMQQFETFSRLHEIWTQRRDGNPAALLLTFDSVQRISESSVTNGDDLYLFEASHGAAGIAVEREFGFFDWLLVPDCEPSVEQVPTEILFDDLLFSGTVFSTPNKFTSDIWRSQPREAVNAIYIANISPATRGRNIALQLFPRPRKPFEAGKAYRLTPRLVDFNSSKILRALLTMDMELHLPGTVPLPFVSFLHDPSAFARTFPTFGSADDLAAETKLHEDMCVLREQGKAGAGMLVLQKSQREATKRLIQSPLSVIHGPPGTGKTYTLALSLLRMIEASYAVQRRPVKRTIFVTAFTHAAIEAFLAKLVSVTASYRELPENYETKWLDDLHTCHVRQGGIQQKLRGGHVHVYLGTAYQLDNFARKVGIMADAVFIDEASQMSVGVASLALRWLRKDECKIVCAGDHFQLGTIMAATYPATSPPLFASLLDFVIGAEARYHDHDGSEPSHSQDSNVTGSTTDTNPVIQITENWRLNADLNAFVSHIYSRPMKSVKQHAHQTGAALRSLFGASEDEDLLAAFLGALGNTMAPPAGARRSKGGRPSVTTTDAAPAALRFKAPSRPYLWQDGDTSQCDSPNSLALLRLRAPPGEDTERTSYEGHVRLEAGVAARLVRLVVRALGPEATVFVATPHRIQRSLVKEALRQVSTPAGEITVDELTDQMAEVQLRDESGQRVRVDTIERLQGQEADVVICCFAHTHRATLMQHLPFLFQRRRLNVGISRAKALCIVITSEDVLRPPLEVLANSDSAEGYSFLRAYEDRAWSGQFEV